MFYIIYYYIIQYTLLTINNKIDFDSNGIDNSNN